MPYNHRVYRIWLINKCLIKMHVVMTTDFTSCTFTVISPNVLFEMEFFALLTFDLKFRLQTAASKYTFLHLSHQQTLVQYTNMRPCYRIKPSTKIAFSMEDTRHTDRKE